MLFPVGTLPVCGNRFTNASHAQTFTASSFAGLAFFLRKSAEGRSFSPNRNLDKKFRGRYER